MNAQWVQMKSGDWALRVPGRRWAVAFVWETWEDGYAFALTSGITHYLPDISNAKLACEELWRVKEERNTAWT